MGGGDLSEKDGGGSGLVEKMVKLGKWEDGEGDGGCYDGGIRGDGG